MLRLQAPVHSTHHLPTTCCRSKACELIRSHFTKIVSEALREVTLYTSDSCFLVLVCFEVIHGLLMNNLVSTVTVMQFFLCLSVNVMEYFWRLDPHWASAARSRKLEVYRHEQMEVSNTICHTILVTLHSACCRQAVRGNIYCASNLCCCASASIATVRRPCPFNHPFVTQLERITTITHAIWGIGMGCVKVADS